MPALAPAILGRPALITLVGLATVCGCSMRHAASPSKPAFPSGMSVAIAPILNFSGNFDLDPVVAADLLASELADFDGIVVLPVSRVVAALAAQGREQVDSPEHALQVAEAVGADAILVAGVTEYDPYTPVIGLVIQMYSRPQGPGSPVRDDGRVEAMRPISMGPSQESAAPIGQIQKVYNATHDEVVSDVRRYARHRDAGDSPYGWQEYLKVQTKYLRFCWHDALGRLANQESGIGADYVRDDDMEHAE